MMTDNYLVQLAKFLAMLGIALCREPSMVHGDEVNFTDPTALVTVNSAKRERYPAISPDGLELYFASDRVGGILNEEDLGQTDIWVARRSSLLQPFGTPVLAPGGAFDFPSPINSLSWEEGPDVSADGLTLFFVSNPKYDDPNRKDEIFYVTRPSLQAPWDNYVELGEGVNSEAWSELSPNISADGLELYFARQQPPYTQISDFDIWRSTRASASDPWGVAALLNINLPDAYDGEPSLSGDDLTLYFTSYRNGGLGSGDIWISRRTSKSEPWGQPVNPGAPLNTPNFDGWADVSADGNALYFARGRGFFDANTDLWQASPLVTQDRVWVPDASDRDWSDSLNWKYGSAPNGNDRNAIFGDAITQERTVRVNLPVTARSIRFDNSHSYHIIGFGTVRLAADVGNSSVSVARGNHRFQVAASLDSPTEVDVAAGATLTFDQALILKGNVLTKTGNGTLVINDDAGVGTVVATAGMISGVGTVVGLLDNVSATLAPGVGPGIFTVDGDYTQETGGTLAIEIGGAGVGQFDELRINGAAEFAGDLRVTLINSFNPTAEYNFDILDFASATGSLNPILPPLDSGLMWDASNLFTTGVLSVIFAGPNGDFNHDGAWNCLDINALTAAIAGISGDLQYDMNGDSQLTLADITAPNTGWLAVGGVHNPAATGGAAFLSGDANLDGTVDGQDFIAWNNNKFTSLAAWCGGDFNADGVVDGQDFIAWNDNKFMSADSIAVPEPSTTTSIFCAFAGLVIWGKCVNERATKGATRTRL